MSINTAAGMQEAIDKLETITLECVSQLDHISYENLQQFLLNREVQIHQIARMDITDEHRAQFQNRIANILKHDEAIVAKMNAFKSAAGQEIVKMSAARKQKSAYETQQHESYYFDKKK